MDYNSTNKDTKYKSSFIQMKYRFQLDMGFRSMYQRGNNTQLNTKHIL
jgi:hypothetical protein